MIKQFKGKLRIPRQLTDDPYRQEPTAGVSHSSYGLEKHTTDDCRP